MKVNCPNPLIECPYCNHEHEFNLEITHSHMEETCCQSCNKNFTLGIQTLNYFNVYAPEIDYLPNFSFKEKIEKREEKTHLKNW